MSSSEVFCEGPHSAWTSPSSCSPGATGIGALLITNLLTALIDSQNKLLGTGLYPADTTSFLDSYDFIVVGSGSAGAVIANRLTEVQDWNVLLLEAGGDPPISSEFPQLLFTIQKTDADWQYETVPQKHGCLGMKGKRCLWPRGKLLGGTSNLNAMIYTRGNKRDFDGWAAAGNEGWNYEEVLPYFKKSENFKPHEQSIPGYDSYSAEYHSQGGYLPVEPFKFRSPIMEGLVNAVKEKGYSFGDRNGETQSGFTIQHGTVQDGTRANTAKSFLAPIKNRKNFHVAKFAHVTKIIIDPKTKTATGVEFIKDGKTHKVSCTKEVVVSGGTINSAQLLMLSGIGPKKHLEELGVTLVQDLSVGENLQDHMMLVNPTYKFNISNPYSQDALKSLDDTYEFLIHRRGPLASVDVLHLLGFFSTKYAHLDVPGATPESTEELDYPDIQIQFIRNPFKDTNGTKVFSDSVGYTEEIYESLFGIPNSEGETFSPLVVLQRPKSRGVIRLKDKDPKSRPLIDPRYLSDDRDVQTLVEGVKMIMEVCKADALKHFETEMSNLPVPGCEAEVLGSDEYWVCVVRTVATTIYHPVGTCKMGPRSDPNAVVDPRLRVHGIQGLRVVDGSVMPTVVSGNTQATIIMIGERGADFIKDDWLH
ncbi:Glucose dehydrogenase [FAD, quinone] [Blattella germanica]|nr:Glucose dehydrogenase [FAD, quinone] [Blattella germanica]